MIPNAGIGGPKPNYIAALGLGHDCLWKADYANY